MTVSTAQNRFDQQRALGERLQALGRTEEALDEFREARELAFREGAVIDSRLSDQIRSTKRSVAVRRQRTQRMWLLFSTLLVLTIAAIFFFWMLDRNTMVETEYALLQDVEALQLEIATLEGHAAELLAVSDLQAGELADNRAYITALEAEVVALEQALASLEPIANDSETMARMEETIAELRSALAAVPAVEPASIEPVAVEATITESETPVIVFAAVEPAEPEAVASLAAEVTNPNQLRITEFSSSLRSGPGFGYPIVEALEKGLLVTVDGRSPDYYWYHVVFEDGRSGWVHTSLAKPIVMDWLPEMAGP